MDLFFHGSACVLHLLQLAFCDIALGNRLAVFVDIFLPVGFNFLS